MAEAIGRRRSDMVSVKAVEIAVSSGTESSHQSWDGTFFATTRHASKRAYQEAGVRDPRKELSLVEVHDCFSITELVTLEDLYISREGNAWVDVLEGFYDMHGGMPCQVDGGLKCFGHPIGASGLRMLYEIYLQLNGRAGDRQVAVEPVLGLTHNLGGFPSANVCSIAILGKFRA